MINIKKFPNRFFILLLLVFMVTACQKDDDGSGASQPQENIPYTFSEYFGDNVSRDFIGNVIDKDQNPIENVTITIGNETTTTDNNGVFMISNANVYERFGYIKAEKPGYIQGSRSVVPSNGTNKVTIMLLEATVIGTIFSGASETVSLPNGGSVSFDGNFEKEDGSPYSGTVDVIMHHLDPADEDMPLQMPGMLYAQNEDGAERMLQTLGMMAVELRGNNGEELNLAEGSLSEIKMPVDNSLMAIAPSTIPLWHFDETKGYWIEEGQATLQGNMYVGNVAHFSFWNCDIPAEAITLCVNVINEAGDELNNLMASITSATFGTRSGYTNDNGQTCGFVPSNETLELNIYGSNFCDSEAIHTESIGPFSEDSNITITIADNPNVIQETVVGMFETCDGNPVTNGYVQLTYGDNTYTDAVSDGVFEINLLRCEEDNTFTVKGNNYDELQTTGNITYTFATPETNIGTLSACNTIEEFIQYTIDGDNDTIILENIQASFYINSPNYDGPTLNISGYGNDDTNNCFYMFGKLNETDYEGNYDFLDWQATNDTGFNIQECLAMSNTNNNITYNLTALGEVGEYIDINFSGTYEDYDGIQHSITGIIHVLRDE